MSVVQSEENTLFICLQSLYHILVSRITLGIVAVFLTAVAWEAFIKQVFPEWMNKLKSFIVNIKLGKGQEVLSTDSYSHKLKGYAI